eukprot:7771419-Ditylum_brightwellii.AAC.1
MWNQVVKTLKTPKIYHVFNCCEDARKINMNYYGQRNEFVRPSIRALDTNDIEGQIIANVLQHGGNFTGAAEVVDLWHKTIQKDHVAVSTVKRHVNKYMIPKKLPTAKTSSSSNKTYSPWAHASYG